MWHFPNKWQPKDGPGFNYIYKSAIRQGDWKLIYNMRDGTKELYNLQHDDGELHNLASVEKKKADALAILPSNQLRQWKAVMPSFKTTCKIVSLPAEVQ